MHLIVVRMHTSEIVYLKSHLRNILSSGTPLIIRSRTHPVVRLGATRSYSIKL